MAQTPVAAAPQVPDHVPEGWVVARREAGGGRDVALDLLRGLAIVVLVINHLRLESALSAATSSVLSAAEVLVAISGVVAGMVFGRRWVEAGARATTVMLLRRARKLYLASVVVVALVGVLSVVPPLETDALTRTGPHGARDLYAFDGAARTVLAVVTLEAGPWQFSILGFFVVMLVVTPALLHALSRGWWPALLALSWALYAAGRAWPVDVLPTQSERAFPVLVWQVLFVHGLVLGRHREALRRRLHRRRHAVRMAVVAAGATAVAFRLGAPELLGPQDWATWHDAHFDKTTLDPARLATMAAIVAALHVVLTRHERRARQALGPLLVPLGRSSFYVFIMHVFACLVIASTPLAAGGAPAAVNALVAAGVVGLLWAMTRRRFLFGVVPR